MPKAEKSGDKESGATVHSINTAGVKVNLEQHKYVQSIAKLVHAQLVSFITPEATESTIVKKAIEILAEFGVTETWYHDVPAFVLLGSRSCLSISGRDYFPENEKVGQTNFITIDLSPKIGEVWGDCARSIAVENGRPTLSPKQQEFLNGFAIEKALHAEMINFVRPQTKFCELYEFSNTRIKHYGYENLDFLGNVGHSIESRASDRRFVDSRCKESLGDVGLFTFEPHIRKCGSKWGFKHEEIYYFDQDGRAIVL